MIGQALYQYDKKGKARTWWVETDGAKVIVNYGQVGGKIAQKVTTAKAKNKGKKNATTPEEQARIEAEAKWRKQVDREDYHWDIDKAGKQLRAMLANSFKESKVDLASGNWVTQPKLDGLRLTYGQRYRGEGERELLTRKGETYCVPHIGDIADVMFDNLDVRNKTGSDVLGIDGELYLHGVPLNQIVHRAKVNLEDSEYPELDLELREELEFHVFDLVMEGVTFRERYNLLYKVIRYMTQLNSNIKIKLVIAERATTMDELLERHGRDKLLGYEGEMVRDLESLYEQGDRSNGLFKYKVMQDAEYRIIDVWEDSAGNAMLTCDNPSGASEEYQSFKCTPKRTHDERKRMLECDALGNSPLIGQWIKVQYQDLTEYGVPQFPVGLEIRACDEKGNPLE